MYIHSNNFDEKIDNFIKAAKEFHKLYRNVPFSIEYSGGDIPQIYMTLYEKSWSHKTAEPIEKICEKHGLRYSVVALGNKLVVTLS